MRTIAMIATSMLLLMGCDAKNNKSIPRPLAKKATFELYVVSATGGANTKTDTDPQTGTTIYLTTPAVITSSDVESVSLSADMPDQKRLNVNLTPNGASKLSAATATPNGMRLAIAVNDKIVSAPAIRATLSNSVSISGDKLEVTLDALTKE
ncbi:SecDF P1 head subdomain-containing protein [Schlesneria paludicola]|uniref:SecDF P1 head subdomain-containing protein n=1 Tax=Schlesneria paludicola TaxID=360056 RepID=UPI00029A6349|nr:hypothetical protein [Schlesneria paludicola]